MTAVKPPTPFALELGRRLRAVRHYQGMSLRQVQETSLAQPGREKGRWKAVVVAAWERGDRGISAEQLAALARFYGVPAAGLIDFEVPVTELLSYAAAAL